MLKFYKKYRFFHKFEFMKLLSLGHLIIWKIYTCLLDQSREEDPFIKFIGVIIIGVRKVLTAGY